LQERFVLSSPTTEKRRQRKRKSYDHSTFHGIHTYIEHFNKAENISRRWKIHRRRRGQSLRFLHRIRTATDWRRRAYASLRRMKIRIIFAPQQSEVNSTALISRPSFYCTHQGNNSTHRLDCCKYVNSRRSQHGRCSPARGFNRSSYEWPGKKWYTERKKRDKYGTSSPKKIGPIRTVFTKKWRVTLSLSVYIEPTDLHPDQVRCTTGGRSKLDFLKNLVSGLFETPPLK
jgi:hypothetical protein